MKKSRTTALLLLSFTLLAGAACFAADAIITPTPPTPSITAPTQASAQAYYQWITECINTIESQMPAITKSAQRAADLYVKQDYDIAVYGGQDFTRELFNRSGGMMQLTLASPLPGTGQEVIDRVNLNKYIILVGLREYRWAEDMDRLRRFRKQGNKFVIGFGSAAQLARAQTDGVWFDAQVPNGAAPANGLFNAPLTGPLVPTDTIANVALGWTWLAEFVAANTRLGKMPAMYQGYETGPSAYEREKKYARVKFHQETPAVIEAGRFGQEYLAALRHDLGQIHDLEMGRIHQTAQQAIATRDAGGTLYTYTQGHVTMDLYPHPHDPGYFQNFERNWGTMRRDIKLAKGDFVLCIGQSMVFRGPDYEDFADVARKAGAKLTWAFSAFKKEEVDAIAPDEPVIDMHYERGDAAVTMPGYDVKILPTSGVLQGAILWMVNSEMLGILESRYH